VTIIFNTAPQGSPEWLQARVGVCTASRFKDALDLDKKGNPSAKCMGYAFDLARQRAGGTVPEIYVNAAMRTGTEQEPLARMAYEAHTGHFLEEVGFAHTDDMKFGVSVDSLIDDDGVWECKTMVSSATLFKAVVDRDISEYRQQCVGALWLLHRQWCDLTLWAPDLPRPLFIERIQRDDNEIFELEAGLMKFERLVSELTAKLLARQAA
jgi:hypothetical protein